MYSQCVMWLQSRGAADIWWDILHHVDGAAEETRRPIRKWLWSRWADISRYSVQ